MIDKSILFVGVFIAIILVIHILISVLFANKMQEITDLKNYEGSIWGWCFFLVFVSGIMGMLIGVLMTNAIPQLQQGNEIE